MNQQKMRYLKTLSQVYNQGYLYKEDVIQFLEFKPYVLEALKCFYHHKFEVSFLEDHTIPTIDFLKCINYYEIKHGVELR